MDSIFYFITSNYLLIIAIAVIIFMAIVGYYAEKTNFGQNKYNSQKKHISIDNEQVKDIQKIVDDNNAVIASIDNSIKVQNSPLSNKEEVSEILVNNEDTNLDERKENIENEKNEELEDLDLAFERAFQDQISIADVDVLDDDIDNMKVDPLFSSDNLNVSSINVDANSNIELPEIKKLESEDPKEDVWKF